ncbi:hypothetical protein QYE76_000869 [Lolium multiflorum]|uniref:F-box domain-containing protein n=1 Tax=Lolium multiflorum TaxID=4521 RepID=A0AAD8VY21_LOLMU|nr:hypothetical protein QYE76_000869 [Lolium multiflorum]
MGAKRQRCAVLEEPMVLPDHLIEEILMRLSLKSLIRCLCLSRAWAATLSSDDFANSYHHVANIHGGGSLAFPRLTTELLSMMEEEEDIRPIAASSVTSQCRGLVIVTATPRGMAFRPDMSLVCNPTTRQMMALPEGRTTGCRGTSINYREKYESLGLGYNVHTKKNKFVRIYYCG